MDTYLGSLGIITHKASTNLDFKKFRIGAKILGIICHQNLVKAYWSIKKIEKYHTSIRYANNIIGGKTRDIISINILL